MTPKVGWQSNMNAAGAVSMGRAFSGRACFAVTLFASACLLFLLQPMVAKMILPLLGGTPAVWNTCMVFFQAALLAAYAYAHAAPNWLGDRRQTLLHLALVALPFLVLPVAIMGWEPAAGGNPVPWLLALLAASVGLPFFVVATSAPLLQRWFAGTNDPAAGDPYFLYAASNLGSMTALLAYPILVEPAFPLAVQSRLWTGGYALLAGLIALCAALARRQRPQCTEVSQLNATGDKAASLSMWRRLRWAPLSFVPSSLLLGVTTYLTTDVAAIPFLWVLPLVLYLLSFVVVFSRLGTLVHGAMVVLLPVMIVLLLVPALANLDLTVVAMLALHLGAFFVAAMVCHGELALTRPPARFLTEYFLWISAGGVLGGAFNALVAPWLFDRVVEYPLLITLVCFLRPHLGAAHTAFKTRAGAKTGRQRGRARVSLLGERLGAYGTVAWTLFGLWTGAVMYATSYAGDPSLIRHMERNFFGVLSVRVDTSGECLNLEHGTTVHGMQSLDPSQRQEPLGYYYRDSPIGQLFSALTPTRAKQPVGVIGLGAGTLAAYAQPEQRWVFYEINPAVERIAEDERYFTYFRDARARGARLRVELGDARLRLGETSDRYELLVLDAFSSDAIPIHLVTRQALAIYLNHLEDDGVLAFHVSSRYLRIEPVLGDLASDAGLVCLFQDKTDLSMNDTKRGKLPSRWVVMAQRTEALGPLASDARWKALQARPGRRVWTDDYSDFLSVVSWQGDGAGKLKR
jgi:hypothetical protein